MCLPDEILDAVMAHMEVDSLREMRYVDKRYRARAVHELQKRRIDHVDRELLRFLHAAAREMGSGHRGVEDTTRDWFGKRLQRYDERQELVELDILPSVSWGTPLFATLALLGLLPDTFHDSPWYMMFAEFGLLPDVVHDTLETVLDAPVQDVRQVSSSACGTMPPDRAIKSYITLSSSPNPQYARCWNPQENS